MLGINLDVSYFNDYRRNPVIKYVLGRVHQSVLLWSLFVFALLTTAERRATTNGATIELAMPCQMLEDHETDRRLLGLLALGSLCGCSASPRGREAISRGFFMIGAW
jgi:hypothetical protein